MKDIKCKCSHLKSVHKGKQQKEVESSHQEFIDIRKKLKHIIDSIDDGCVMDYVQTKLKEIK